MTFTHNPEHLRVKQEGPNDTTIYVDDPASGLHVEKLSGTGGSVRWNNYITAADGMVAVYFEIVAGGGTSAVRYFHKDNLGSVSVVTDENATVVERDGYDSWGKRRYPNGNDDTSNVLTSVTSRGFTGHEHLEEVTLIHMNGRVYDPYVGRFASADPFVQDPLNAQSFNRFAYTLNNPLMYTDPTGYFSLGGIFKAVFGGVSQLFHALHSNPIFQAAEEIGAAIACAPGGPEASAGCAAGVSAFNTGINGGNVGQIFKSAVITFATAEAFQYVGDATGGHLNGDGTFGDARVSADKYFLSGDHLANIAGHAAVGCASSAAGGGRCAAGAFAGAAGSFAGPIVAKEGFVVGIVSSATVSGVASVIGGGKFANGAATGAFGYLFNETLHVGLSGEYPGFVAKAIGWLTGSEDVANGAGFGLVVQYPSLSDKLAGRDIPYDLGVYGQISAPAAAVEIPALDLQGSIEVGGGKGTIHGTFDGLSTNYNVMIDGLGGSATLSPDKNGQMNFTGAAMRVGGGWGGSATASFTAAGTIRDLLFGYGK